MSAERSGGVQEHRRTGTRLFYTVMDGMIRGGVAATLWSAERGNIRLVRRLYHSKDDTRRVISVTTWHASHALSGFHDKILKI